MKALTLILYSTSSSKSVRVIFSDVVLLMLVDICMSNVSRGTYSTSYEMISPFSSIGRTLSHVTRISVDDRTMVVTLRGAVLGPVEEIY